jgi:hypothetical protein
MRDIPTSPRLENIKRKRKARRIRLLILFTVLVLSLFAGVAYFSAYPRLTIHTIDVSGNRIINASDIQTAVSNDISGRYMHLFARDNILLYPKQKIQNDLRATFPRIKSVTISLDHFNTLVVAIDEREAAFLYCGDTIPQVPSQVGENCFFLNNDGYIFSTAPYFSGDVYFKYYMKLPDTATTPLGSQMMSPDQFHALASFIDKVQALGFDPIYLSGDTDGIDTLYINNQINSTNPTIIFKADDDLSVVLDNLKVALAQSAFADQIHTKYATLEYIDLRFKDKVLYKFQ